MSKELSNARAGLESRATYTNIIFFQKDLPEIPELDITIDDDVQLVELGVIFSIVESMGKNISYVDCQITFLYLLAAVLKIISYL